METEKDKAIESKGQQITNNLSLSSFFNDNNSCLFVFRKTEKLAAAIFLLTDLFEKDNPFRHKFRNLSTELLLSSLELTTCANIESGMAEEVKKRGFEILLMLESAYFAGLISEMNLRVFRREYTPVLSILEEGLKRNVFEKPVTPEKFWQEDMPAAPDFSIRQDKGQSVSYEEKTPVFLRSARNDDESLRTKTILSLIKKQGEVSVKNVSSVLKNWSEKTIQRDLLSLVGKGVLKKKGERRWSRYSLTQ